MSQKASLISSESPTLMHWFCQSCTEPALALLKKEEGGRMIGDLCQQYMTSFAEEYEVKMRKTEDLIAVKNEVSELRKKLSSPVKGTETTQAPTKRLQKLRS